jgi:thioredoxin reductase (NADPH)
MSFFLKTFLLISLQVFSGYGFAVPSGIDKVDIVVLGGGSAGLTSAIYLGRAGLSPLVLEGNILGGAITQSTKVQNFPGYQEISGADLAHQMRAQAEKSGAVFAEEEIIAADLSEHPFIFTVQHIYDKARQRKIAADACVIALGATPRKLGVPGEEKYWSSGVYTCAVCDGSLYKDKVVAVVGGGDSAVLEADYLAGIAKKVYVLVRKDKMKGQEKTRLKNLQSLPNVEIKYEVAVHEILGNEEEVKELRLAEASGKETSLPIDALFLAIGATPNTKYFEKQLELDPDGYIVLRKECETSIPGVFVAGDISDPIYKQAVIASGEGAKAAMKAQGYLASLKASSSEKKQLQIAEVIEIKNLSQLKEIARKSDVPVLIDFYATWCGPCRYLSPMVDKWAKDLQGKAVVCKVNVDEVRDVAMNYQIRSMPTFISISPDGKELDRKIGVEKIIQYVEQVKKK